MVKTLRITSVVAALLAIAVFALPIKYGVKTDANIQKFLNSPGVLEKFKAISGNRTQKPTGQVHPLVQQSQEFARIIAPPDPVRPAGNDLAGTRPIFIPEPPSTVQFTVKSISFCETNPELSQALINEPGKGTYWVRQASTVNHQMIEQIKDGVVIVNNGQRSVEVKIDEKKFSPAPPGVIKPVARGNTPPAKSTRPPTIVTPATPPETAKAPVPLSPKTEPQSEPDPEREKRVEELREKIKLLGSSNNDPNDPQSSMESKAAQMQKLLIEFRNSNININEDEAKKLADLGAMLESVRNPPPEN